MLLTERSALTTAGSIRLRDFCAFLIHRGGMFARNLKNPRTAEPELDVKSLASLGLATRLLQAFEVIRTTSRKNPMPSGVLSAPCNSNINITHANIAEVLVWVRIWGRLGRD